MKIKKVKIQNFKCFRDFTINFENNLNIIVGNNESGKSTILEAINLALSGYLNGKSIKNDFSEYLFNKECEKEYLKSIENNNPIPLPSIIIEIYFSECNDGNFKGTQNLDKSDDFGIRYKIEFDEKYNSCYEELIKNQKDKIKTIPIEYYQVSLYDFADNIRFTREIPLKSFLIDSSDNKFQNGSDICITRIIEENLNDEERIELLQEYRKLKEDFGNDNIIQKINSKYNENEDSENKKLSNKKLSISIDLSTRNAWNSLLMTYFNDIPFHQVGKGEQCIIKTILALLSERLKNVGVLLIEEPESHLSYSKMNELIQKIEEHINESGKQIIITTHSNFVSNKLGLNNLILLNEQKTTTFKNLSIETQDFFKKLPNYDTLRLILCKKAILVEGASDELIVQKAYSDKYKKLPIKDGIDIITAGGLTFLNFLEIANQINKKIKVITDNDGDIESLKEKYEKYENYTKSIYYDKQINKKENFNITESDIITEKDTRSEKIKKISKSFNYNTLEPCLLRDNSITKLNEIFGTNYINELELLKYMYNNKTTCAIKIFETKEEIKIPYYIMEAI